MVEEKYVDEAVNLVGRGEGRSEGECEGGRGRKSWGSGGRLVREGKHGKCNAAVKRENLFAGKGSGDLSIYSSFATNATTYYYYYFYFYYYYDDDGRRRRPTYSLEQNKNYQ